MEIILAIFFFILGTIIGSFINVVAIRYNSGSGFGGRSHCMTCGKTLRWYELIPIFSYLIQAGKCRQCGAKISIQYPIVEFITGLIYLSVYLKYSYLIPLSINFFILFSVFVCVTLSVLMVIVVYDARHKIVPDALVVLFAVLALIRLVIDYGFTGLWKNNGLLDLLAGPILFAFFFILWLISSGRWIGAGDAKLALGIGWLMGLVGGVSSVVMAFWTGAIVAIGMILAGALKGNNKIGMKSEIPFVPFLAFGLAIALFFKIDALGLKDILALVMGN